MLGLRVQQDHKGHKVRQVLKVIRVLKVQQDHKVHKVQQGPKDMLGLRVQQVTQELKELKEQ
jgi:uncharacterized protein YbjQ (UPF0145 family)